jgi:hypothetical protein
MSEQVVDEQEAAKPKHLTVTVHNEDAGGEPIEIEGEPKTKVETIIHRMYKDLDTERKEGDRLTCLANGGDVFPHAHQELEHYAEHECHALEWGFARATGGA